MPVLGQPLKELAAFIMLSRHLPPCESQTTLLEGPQGEALSLHGKGEGLSGVQAPSHPHQRARHVSEAALDSSDQTSNQGDATE